ncbi:glycosyltransferase WbuB [Lacihabitans sp. CCS-44]|uniref:glycosyltransferase family 4 protein n=1 Tax=Lacihabitans sp. CCS-44 TaxID=2487331 RepID=UPI0020CFC5CA|nr:glycosyltransferase family 4 protein [Lacihabitans sp. CCS-44]MCP9754970.1 glycosyltransferase WbuB [Lacihabitans sp. CCS-44]
MKGNILFITLVQIKSIHERGIYTDLIRKFNNEGYNVYVLCPIERKYGKKTFLKKEENVQILNVRTLNIQKTNLFEKAVSTLSLEYLFLRAIDRFFLDIKVDLILYSTPPITLTRIIDKLKRRFGAKTYLLLKDIFPQNAVDMDMISKSSIIYKYFRKKEISLYKLSDTIGCMSDKNIEFLINHNPFLNPSSIELNPNSLELKLDQKWDKKTIRVRFNLPIDSTVFLYGGNLGKPQGIDFLIEILKVNLNKKECFFLIVGDGTEYSKLEGWLKRTNANNIRLLKSLPKTEYDELVKSVDVGLIFLDYRFTIPNFPSRLLSYLESKVPVLAATDINTDLGDIVVQNHFGLWSSSNDIVTFNKHLEYFIAEKAARLEMGQNGFNYMKNNYLIGHSFNKIISKLDV